jgi:hypothetical protein
MGTVLLQVAWQGDVGVVGEKTLEKTLVVVCCGCQLHEYAIWLNEVDA